MYVYNIPKTHWSGKSLISFTDVGVLNIGAIFANTCTDNRGWSLAAGPAAHARASWGWAAAGPWDRVRVRVHDAQTRSARQGQRGSRLGMAGDSLVGSVVSPTRGYHLGGDGFPSDGSAAQPALAWTTVPADDHCCALCPSEFLYVFETIDDILIIIGWVCVYRP